MVLRGTVPLLPDHSSVMVVRHLFPVYMMVFFLLVFRGGKVNFGKTLVMHIIDYVKRCITQPGLLL